MDWMLRSACCPPQELADRNSTGAAPAALRALRGTPCEDFVGRVPCDFLHPGMSHDANTFQFLPQAYLRALPVYAFILFRTSSPLLMHQHAVTLSVAVCI